MFERKNPHKHKHRTNKLLGLLIIYRGKKHIQMKPIMNSVYDRLKNNRPISKRQLEVLIPYLKNDLKTHSIEQIFDEFSCCIYDVPTVSDIDYISKYYPHIIEDYERRTEPNTLEKFMI